MKYLLSTSFVIIFFATAASAQINSLKARADSLFEVYEEKAALKAYNKILAKHPQNVKALWRSSLLYSRIGYRLEDEDKKVRYFKKAKKRAKRALELKPKSTHTNFAMAVAMGRMALISGARERVAAARAIKKYGSRALRYDSTNAGAWYLLGRWNYEVDNLNFAEQLAANLLFGGLPDGASTRKAVRYIKKAIELRPKYIMYYYDLAVAYAELDKEAKAIATCRKALSLPSLTPTDPQTKEDCRELIDDLK